jgi:hypothetical protein
VKAGFPLHPEENNRNPPHFAVYIVTNTSGQRLDRDASLLPETITPEWGTSEVASNPQQVANAAPSLLGRSYAMKSVCEMVSRCSFGWRCFIAQPKVVLGGVEAAARLAPNPPQDTPQCSHEDRV